MPVASPAISKEWVVGKLLKLIDAERSMAGSIGQNAKTPPHEVLSCLYHEISAADEGHAEAIKIIAARYGYIPVRTERSSIGDTIGRLKERFTALGSDSSERLIGDLLPKAEAIYRYTAWVQIFKAMGDTASADELTSILADEQAHRDTLQVALNKLVEERARQA
jgi:hypothetical protein